MQSKPPGSRKLSLYGDMGPSQFVRLTSEEIRQEKVAQVQSSRPVADRRASIDSGATSGPGATPTNSIAEPNSRNTSGGRSQELSDGPAHRLAMMRTQQMAAVLGHMVRLLRKSCDYDALRLLLADLGKEMEAQVSEDVSHEMAYVTLNDVLLQSESRHGPHQGDYHRPNAVVRFFARCCGRRL